MTGFLIAGLCLAGSALIVGGLHVWIGSGDARFNDLTRPADFVDQADRYGENGPRAINNELAVSVFRTKWEAGGHNVRPLPVRPEPAQLHGWEDDGGATA